MRYLTFLVLNAIMLFQQVAVAQSASAGSKSTEIGDTLAQCSAVYYLHFEDAKKRGQGNATTLNNLYNQFKNASMKEYTAIGVDANRANTVGLEIISNYYKGLAVDQKNGTNKAVNWINNYKQACDQITNKMKLN